MKIFPLNPVARYMICYKNGGKLLTRKTAVKIVMVTVVLRSLLSFSLRFMEALLDEDFAKEVVVTTKLMKVINDEIST